MFRKVRIPSQLNHIFRHYGWAFLAVCLLSSNSLADTGKPPQDGSKQYPFELVWSDLIPEGYNTEALLKKFEKDIERLNNLPEDSEEGLKIVERIQAAVDKIPTNTKWDGKWVKIPGFIAPLEVKNGAVNRFLLVPYFGACIHVPPPPVNQTVLVYLKKKQGISLEEIDYPFLITGKLTLDKTTTDIGKAGYELSEASAKIYHDTGWLEE